MIPVILCRGHQAYKGEGFDSWRSVGSVRNLVRVYQARQVDELVLLDIAATKEGREPDWELLNDLSGDCFFPLTIGGGIRTVDHFVKALRNGADKIAINTMALECPELITEAAKKVGGQSVVVSIDVAQNRVFSHAGTKDKGRCPIQWAKEAESRGAGEIILTAIERDGTLEGYDLDLIQAVSDAVSIPVVAAGGAGRYEDFKLAFEHGAHGVAAGAMWSFTEATPSQAAEYLAMAGVPVRRKAAA